MKPKGWSYWLQEHPDHAYTSTIIDIIRYGVKIGYTGPKQFLISQNHPSAAEAPATLTADLDKQINANRVGRFTDPPRPWYICSPLGLVPKHDGGWRRIHDLSYPSSRSVNDNIPKAFGELEYATVDEAIYAILLRGQGAVLIKRDLADAFRHIPVANEDHWLLGFQWDNAFWSDYFLPFGLRTAPFLFDLFAKGLHWILIARLNWAYILHYLDDFLAVLSPEAIIPENSAGSGASQKLISAENSAGNISSFTAQIRAEYGDLGRKLISPENSAGNVSDFEAQFQEICNDLGLRVNLSKNSAGTQAEFLGIELDTVLMEARLPQDKLLKAQKLTADLLATTQVSHDDLESATGFLSFAAKVVVPGRAFLRRLFDALRTNQKSYIISSQMRADLKWWSVFLRKWNGVRLLRLTAARVSLHLYTDASGKNGMGGYIIEAPEAEPTLDLTVSLRMPTRQRRKHINVKEMLAILLCMRRWRQHLHGSHLILHCDSQAVVHGLKRLSIRGGAMAPLRAIAMILAEDDIWLTVVWIPTKQNALADMLSRFQYKEIANAYPQLAGLRGS